MTLESGQEVSEEQMNELEKRAAEHKKKQDGLSPFCSLGERLDRKSIDKNRIDIARLLGIPSGGIIVSENGRVEIHNIPEDDARRYSNILRNKVKDIRLIPGKYDFRKVPLPGQVPGRLVTISGMLKDNLTEEFDDEVYEIPFRGIIYKCQAVFLKDLKPGDKIVNAPKNMFDVESIAIFDSIVEYDNKTKQTCYRCNAVVPNDMAETRWVYTPMVYKVIEELPDVSFQKQVDKNAYVITTYLGTREKLRNICNEYHLEAEPISSTTIKFFGKYSDIMKYAEDFHKIRDVRLNEAKKKKKKRLGGTLNPDAGNVEHNINMFNHMNSPTGGPSNNPVSGPFGGDVCAESLNEAAPKKETIELEYKNLEFTQYGTQRDADDWDEWDRCMDWTYEVDKDDLYTFIFESCIDETDFPEAFEDEFDPNNPEHWARFESWLDDNFDAIYSKYEEKILENWEEDAAEEASDEYDPDDYVDWDSMPGGHDDDRYWEDMDEAVAGIRAGSQESTKVFMDSTDDPDNFVAVKVTTEFTTDGDFNSHMFDDGAPVLKYFYRGGTSRVYDVKIPKNSWLIVSPWYGEVFRFNGKGWIMLQDSPSDIQEFTTYVEESDDLKEGEEVFMEKYSYGLNEEYKREPKMIDYFEQMNSEEDEA